ncbi:hypothetical protein ACLOJK_017072 [Asimina triloba]
MIMSCTATILASLAVQIRMILERDGHDGGPRLFAQAVKHPADVTRGWLEITDSQVRSPRQAKAKAGVHVPRRLKAEIFELVGLILRRHIDALVINLCCPFALRGPAIPLAVLPSLGLFLT